MLFKTSLLFPFNLRVIAKRVNQPLHLPEFLQLSWWWIWVSPWRFALYFPKTSWWVFIFELIKCLSLWVWNQKKKDLVANGARAERHVESGYVCVKATGRWWVGAGWGHSYCRSCHGWATPDPQRGPKGQATAISPCSPGRENPGPGHWVLGAWGPWEQPAGPSGPESRDPDTRLSPGGWHVQTWAIVSVAFRVQTHTHVCLHEEETRVRKFSWRGLLVPASLKGKKPEQTQQSCLQSRA